MEKFHRRILVFAVFILLFFVGLGTRLFYLQGLKGNYYSQFSRDLSLRKIRLQSPRGRILDRNGMVLAENRPFFHLSVIPAQIKDKKRNLKTLAYLLDWEEKVVAARLKNKGLGLGFVPSTLAEDLSREEVAKIRGKISLLSTQAETDFDMNGIHLELKYGRVYPEKELGGHLLGYVREARGKDLIEWEAREPGRVGPGDQVGVTGVEKTFDEILRGYDGLRYAWVNAMGREVVLQDMGLEKWLEDRPIQVGQDILLSVDKKLTEVAYRAFGEKVGALVALDPRTGEILAMVSAPAYNPQDLTGVVSHSLWNYFRDHPGKILLNRPLQAAYPPGSTHKIVTAIAGLAEGKTDFKQRIRCHGHYQYGDRKWGCWKRGGHGLVNLHQALVQSCDVYFYTLGQKLGPDLIAKYAKLLGLGEKTQVLKGYERSGLIPTREWKLKSKQEEWRGSDDLSNAIGQGFNLVTPLQNALMVARLANGTKAIVPHLLKSTRDTKGDFLPAILPSFLPLDLNLNQEQRKGLKHALKEVVHSPVGTGKRARVNGIQVAGKSGTSQVVGLSRKGKGKRGVNTEDHAWFVAYAPAENPEIALAVVVEHGGSGGAVAAPIAGKVLNAYFENKKKDSKTEKSKIRNSNFKI